MQISEQQRWISDVAVTCGDMGGRIYMYVNMRILNFHTTAFAFSSVKLKYKCPQNRWI